MSINIPKISVNLTPDTIAILLGVLASLYRTISDITKMLSSPTPPTKEQIAAILESDKKARDASLERLRTME